MMLKTSENGFKIQKSHTIVQKSEAINFGRNGGTGNVEGFYDAVRGHRTGSSNSPAPSVPVNPLPVSREASRDFVALDIWLHRRYRYLN